MRHIINQVNGHDARWVALALVTSAVGAVVTGCGKGGSANVSGSATSKTQSNESSNAAWFTDVASTRGVHFTWQSGHAEQHMIPEITGGGAAMFDFNNDGFLDLYLVQGGRLSDPSQRPPNVLLRNRGDGSFEEVPSAGGAMGSGYGMGAACGDFNNDGWIDLYVTNIGPNLLYQNNGDGTFTDVTDRAGIGHPGWGTSAAFVDMDRDGDLDLYVCNYLNWSVETEHTCYNLMGMPDYCPPRSYVAPAIDALYRNEGDGRFTDVTTQAGLDAAYGTGLGVVCDDFNKDGWIDIFVANDGMRNQLWINKHDGTFSDHALLMGCAVDEEGRAKAGMGVSAMDFDDDGDVDVLVGNMRSEADTLFLHEGTHFLDATVRAGLRTSTKPYTTFGLGWLDFDNDGILDLLQVHGAVMREGRSWSQSDPYAQPNLLFQGNSDGRFVEVNSAFASEDGRADTLIHTSRAAAFGDFDNDGGIDVLVINRNAPAYLLRNTMPARGHWVRFRVMDGRRDAEGAIVTVTIDGRTIMRTVRAAFSYLASNDPRVHLGLGTDVRVDDLRVQWVDGTVESFGSFNADKDHVIRRGEGNTRE